MKLNKIKSYVLFCSCLFSLNLYSEPFFCIITGAPGTGKTTLIKALSKKDCETIPEAATALILEYGKEYTREIGREEFQRQIWRKQIADEAKLKLRITDAIAFIDRGIPDGICYFLYDKLEVPKKLITETKNAKKRTKIVFLLDHLPEKLFTNTSIRRSTPERAAELHKLLKQTYKKYGYNVVEVPFFEDDPEGKTGPEQRADFVLEEIEKFKAESSS